MPLLGSATPALKPFAPTFHLAETSPLAARRLYPALEEDAAAPAPSSPVRTLTCRSRLPAPVTISLPDAKVSIAQF